MLAGMVHYVGVELMGLLILLNPANAWPVMTGTVCAEKSLAILLYHQFQSALLILDRVDP